MVRPVVHWEIYARDLAKTRSFYAELFGWHMQDFTPEYTLVDTGGEGGIGGGIMQAPPEMNPVVTFYVMVDDLDASLKKAVSLGGTTMVPPTPIPNVGHFALFADLDGQCIGLFKSDGGPMPEPPKRPGCPVIWWEIMSRDGKQAREFYGKLFDWPIKYDAAMDYGEVQPGEPRGIGGGIVTTKDPAGKFTYVSFYTQVDDLQKYLDRAVSLGGKVMMEPMPIPNVGTIAYFKDPEGRPMGLFKSQ